MMRAPSRAKRLTVSDPINPADPVTMIVRIMSYNERQFLSCRLSMWAGLLHAGASLEFPSQHALRLGSRRSLLVLVANDPCDFARRRIHSRGGKLPVALKHTLDQFGTLRRADEKQNVPGTIDERKCERQSPCIQFGNKIRHDCTRHLFQCGGLGKE